jgi:hypothetical protein
VWTSALTVDMFPLEELDMSQDFVDERESQFNN